MINLIDNVFVENTENILYVEQDSEHHVRVIFFDGRVITANLKAYRWLTQLDIVNLEFEYIQSLDYNGNLIDEVMYSRIKRDGLKIHFINAKLVTEMYPKKVYGLAVQTIRFYNDIELSLAFKGEPERDFAQYKILCGQGKLK